MCCNTFLFWFSLDGGQQQMVSMWQKYYVDMKSLLSWQYLMKDFSQIHSWNITMVSLSISETFQLNYIDVCSIRQRHIQEVGSYMHCIKKSHLDAGRDWGSRFLLH